MIIEDEGDKQKLKKKKTRKTRRLSMFRKQRRIGLNTLYTC